ncbi:MAG: hypothetical protein QGF72_05910 [Candidatus Poseidoniaceae archaeon]|jgi:hypothetical protein|nr:hypothetical protein [Candidatus Poseidoniaceae archaeon]
MHITTKAVLGIGAIITVVGIVMFANGQGLLRRMAILIEIRRKLLRRR